MTSSPIFTFDWTLSVDKQPEHNLIIEHLRERCKKWAFQEELGEGGFLHWQGRMSLNEKKRLKQVIKEWQEILPSIHLSATSKQNQGNNFYVLKDDTWTGKHRYTNVDKPIPIQIRHIETWRPWQQQIIDSCAVYEPRTVNCLIDKNGGVGKTSLVTHMGVKNLARRLPFSNDYKDLLRMTYAIESKAYLIDMPRAISKDRLYQLYSAIETIKDGYAYDDRYAFKERYFDSPTLWIFTNAYPDTTLLSEDRWCFWHVVNNCLEPYTHFLV